MIERGGAGGPTIQRHRLGAELRRLREARVMRLEDVAIHLGVATSTISRIENGKAPTRTSYLTLMLDLYGVDDQEERQALVDAARAGQRKEWWAEYEDVLPSGAGQYLGLEAAAAKVCSYSLLTVPGLLQTEEYAAAVIRATRPELNKRQVDRLVTVQLRRQDLARANSPKIHAIIDESVLRRLMYSPDVMAGQLAHLLASLEILCAEVQVIKLDAIQTILSYPFAVLSLPGGKDAAAVSTTNGKQPRLSKHAADVNTASRAFDRLSQIALTCTKSARLIDALRS
jgi:transcriptional regulator with XRE-family HTH domain